MKILGREVSMWVSLAVAAVAVLSALWLGWDMETQGVVNAALAALGGVVVAVFVQRDKILPAVVGFAEAVLAVTLAFNVDVSPEAQSSVLALVTVATGFFVRQNVVAPVPAEAVSRG